jgi:hypothetical protein
MLPEHLSDFGADKVDSGILFTILKQVSSVFNLVGNITDKNH